MTLQEDLVASLARVKHPKNISVIQNDINDGYCLIVYMDNFQMGFTGLCCDNPKFLCASFGSYYGAHIILTSPRPALQFTQCIVPHQCDKLTNAVKAVTSYHLYTDFTQNMI